MEVIMSTSVRDELKTKLDAKGKTAARFVVNSFGCRGPVFDIELSDKTDGDASFEVDGILFVVEEKLLVGIRNPEIVKSGEGFSVKRSSCGC